jgi:hypothetical protein
MLLGGGSNCQGCGCVGDPCSPANYVIGGGDPSYVDGDLLFAQSFITPPDGLTLTSVTMSIATYDELRYLGPDDGYENYPTARLYASEYCEFPYTGYIRPVSYFDYSAYQVAGFLAELTSPSIESLDASTWTFTHSGYSLTGNTRYFISLEKNGSWNPFYTFGTCNFPSVVRSLNAGQTWDCNTPYQSTAQYMTVN